MHRTKNAPKKNWIITCIAISVALFFFFLTFTTSSSSSSGGFDEIEPVTSVHRHHQHIRTIEKRQQYNRHHEQADDQHIIDHSMTTTTPPTTTRPKKRNDDDEISVEDSSKILQLTPPKCPLKTVHDDSNPAARHHHHHRQKVLTFNSLYSWFGLTNQMLCYAAAARYALEENRSVLFPNGDSNIDFHLLFNATLYFRILQETITVSPSVPNRIKEQVKTLKMAWREDTKLSQTEEKKANQNQNQNQQQNKKRSYFHTPLSFPAQMYQRDPDLVTFVPSAAFPFTSMNKKNLFLPNRDVYRVSDDTTTSSSTTSKLVKSSELFMRNLHQKASKYNYTRHHNFFMRYPWVLSSTISPVLQEAHFLNSLQPVDSIEKFWSALCKRLMRKTEGNDEKNIDDERCAKWVHERVTTIHLRLESDALLLSKKLPGAKQVIEWLKDEVLLANSSSSSKPLFPPPPSSSSLPKILYICIGNWPSRGFETAMLEFAREQKKAHNIEIWWRKRLITDYDDKKNSSSSASSIPVASPPLPHLPKSIGSQRETHQKSGLKVKSTQDHYLSFVDFLFLARSAKAILSRYSSLKFAVYAKRCYPRHQEEEVKKVLRCWLPFQQRVEWDDDNDNKNDDKDSHDDHTFVFDVDEKADGKISEVSAVSCSDRSKRGWAGFKDWN